jgi:hypothetical protein
LGEWRWTADFMEPNGNSRSLCSVIRPVQAGDISLYRESSVISHFECSNGNQSKETQMSERRPSRSQMCLSPDLVRVGRRLPGMAKIRSSTFLLSAC